MIERGGVAGFNLMKNERRPDLVPIGIIPHHNDSDRIQSLCHDPKKQHTDVLHMTREQVKL